MKYAGEDAAVVAYVGDGGTSEGDFYEALNFAGVWKAPLVTIIENNQWAISVPRSRQTAAATLAQKGIAAGIRCIQVDGNDVDCGIQGDKRGDRECQERANADRVRDIQDEHAHDCRRPDEVQGRRRGR